MIVGVKMSSGNSAPNSANNSLTIPFEGGVRSFKGQGACVSGGLNVRYNRVCVHRGGMKVRIHRVCGYRGN